MAFMRFAGLCLLAFIALANILVVPPFCREAGAKEPGTKNAASKNTANKNALNELVFPQQFSIGKLYNYPAALQGIVVSTAEVEKAPVSWSGEAKGKVTVTGPRYLYLVPSYQLCEHPEVLATLDPNIISSISFNKLGILQPLDKAIEPLSHLTGLRRLEMQCTELPDDCLKPLKSLTKLEVLDLSMCGLRGTFLPDLSNLTSLKELELSDNALDPAAFTAIAKFHNLRILNVVRTGVNDASLAQIAKLENLESLYLANARVTGKGLRQLQKLKKLRFLELTDTNLQAADLLCLAPLKLKSLFLPHKYSLQDTQMLRRAMPATAMGLLHQPVDKETQKLFAPTRY
jgi:hypothetical protein